MAKQIDFGRIRHHDPKSRDYAYPEKAVSGKRDIRHAMNALHLDQFYTGGCVGFSGTTGLNTVKGVNSRRKFNSVFHQYRTTSYLNNNDGLTNYSGATRLDEFPGTYPPTDTGSSALGLMKWWTRYGIIGGYRWTFTFDSFLAALTAQPVLTGTVWYDDMMETGPDGIVHSAASGAGGDSGHEYLATEILWSKQLIGYEQTWGQNPPGFGKYGRFWIPFDLAEELIINQEGDVCVPRFL